MENLDNDVLENILFRLPIGTSSSNAKRVCKSWKAILDNRRHNEVGYLFACRDYKDDKIQLYFGEEYDQIDIGNNLMMNNYYSNETLMEMEHGRFAREYYDDNILVGSCNGLVCFQKVLNSGIGVHEPLTIFNPLTGEYIYVKPNFPDEPKRVTTGFGYCQRTNKYKVVRLYTFDWQTLHVQVYTVGSKEWRDMETVVLGTFRSPGIFANGVLHWLSADIDGSYIVAFDLEDEAFHEIPQPPPEVFEPKYTNVDNKLTSLGGNLCWFQLNRIRCGVDIWAYKRTNNNGKYGMEEHDQKDDYYKGNSWNWVKDFCIYTGCFRLKPFGITKSNQLLLLVKDNFYCYDPKTGSSYKLGDDNGVENCSCIHQAIPHANSYVSLKDSGETWYGPGSSAVSQTNSSVLLTEVGDAYLLRKRKRQS